MSNPYAAGLFGLIGGALLLGSLFGAYNYVQLSRMPLVRPSEAGAGDTVAMELTVAESTPTVEAPFSREPAAIAYWQVEEYDYDPDGSSWTLVDSGIEHADVLHTRHGAAEVTVDLPAEMDGRDIPESGGRTTVETAEEPSAHVRQFERDNVDPLLGDDGRRRYSEDRFTVGETLTVYGRVEATDGGSVAGDRFKLTPDGPRFAITREQPSQTKRKRLLGTVAALAFGAVFVGVAVALL